MARLNRRLLSAIDDTRKVVAGLSQHAEEANYLSEEDRRTLSYACTVVDAWCAHLLERDCQVDLPGTDRRH